MKTMISQIDLIEAPRMNWTRTRSFIGDFFTSHAKNYLLLSRQIMAMDNISAFGSPCGGSSICIFMNKPIPKSKKK